MNVKIRRATRARVERVFKKLRAEDREEVFRASGLRGPAAYEMLLQGYRSADVAYCLEADGQPIAVLGLHATPLGGVVWMLCTDEVTKHKKSVLRHGTDIAAKWYRRFGTLICVADNENTLHHRWIKMVGFLEHRQIDQNGHPFTQYLYRGRSH